MAETSPPPEDVPRSGRGRTHFEAIRFDDPRLAVGALPAIVVLGLVAAVLWGAGYELPLTDGVAADSGATSTREAIGWLGGVLLIALAGAAVLPWVARCLCGEVNLPLIAPFFAERERLKRDRLVAELWEANGHDPDLSAGSKMGAETWLEPPGLLTGTLRLHLRFPRTTIRPTALGNVLEAIPDRLWWRYGIDAAAIWPLVRPLVSAEARSPLAHSERRCAVALALSAGSVFALLAVLAITAVYAAHVPAVVLAPIAIAVLARRAYVAATGFAIQYGQALEASIELHRFELLTRLRLPLPKTRHEERATFARLSRALALGQELDAPYQDAIREAVTPDFVLREMDAATKRMQAAVRSAVDQGIDEALGPAVSFTLTNAIAETVPHAIEQGLREAIAGPPLVNYDGLVTVQIVDSNGLPVTIGSEHDVALDVGTPYHVRVTVGQRGSESPGLTVPLVVTDGVEEDHVTFTVEIDSDRRSLRRRAQPVTLHRWTESAMVTLEPPLMVDGSLGEPWLWVRVAQQERVVQNVELSTTIHQQQ